MGECDRMNDSVDLTTYVGPLALKNPVLLASGTCGYGLEMTQWYDISILGGLVTKSLSLQPRHGNAPPRIAELPTGMLNTIGLENIGIKAFIETKLPELAHFDTCIIVSLFGEDIDEFCTMAQMLDAYPEVAGLELNISCPNVKEGGMTFGVSPELTEQLVHAVRSATQKPIIVKLTPNDTNIFEVGQAALRGGADILSLVNTFLGMSVDIHHEKPRLSSIVGGYSGPGIFPIALRMVYEMVQKTQAPVIGIGGISSAEDALQYLFVGAQAVQLGTINFVNPLSAPDIIRNIQSFLQHKGFKSVQEWIGRIGSGT